MRTVDDNTQAVWVGDTDSNDLKSDASDLFDAEYVEHDAALSVFKSPRPSYTLDELQEREVRERLMEEQRKKDNPWDAVRHGGGYDTRDESGDVPNLNTEEGMQMRGGLASFAKRFLVGAFGEEQDQWEEASSKNRQAECAAIDDWEEDEEEVGSASPLDISYLPEVLGGEQVAWAEICGEAASGTEEEEEEEEAVEIDADGFVDAGSQF